MVRRPEQWWLVAVALVVAVPADHVRAAEPRYHVAARWTVGGEGGWDYLTADTAARRLYVAHATRIEVLDLDSGKPVGAVTGIDGAHGVALAPELGRGFASSGRDSAVVVFDLKTLASISRLRVPARNPDAILYEPASRRVFTFNGGSANTTVFDAASGAYVDSLALGGKPEFAVADGGRVFVNIESTSELVVFDARTLKIEHRWPLAPGEEPSGLAIDRQHHLLFSGCSNRKLVVMDGSSGAMVTALTIGEGVDAAAFDARRQLAFASCGDGTLAAYRAKPDRSFEAVPADSTQRGARTMAIDERTGRAFLATASFGPPPAPTPDRPRPRPTILPGSFVILVAGP
jgi:hypothetical protein